MEPTKLIRLISDLPPAEWSIDHYIQFVEFKDTKLSPLKNFISQNSIDGKKFLNLTKKDFKSLIDKEELFKNFEYWKNELLSISELNKPKFELTEMNFSKINSENDDEIDPFPYSIKLMNFSKLDKILLKILSEEKTEQVKPNQSPIKISSQLYLQSKKSLYCISKESCPIFIGRIHDIPENKEKIIELSKNHCKILYKKNEDKFILKDAGSSNGTYVLLPRAIEIKLEVGLNLEVSGRKLKVLDLKTDEVQLSIDSHEKIIRFKGGICKCTIKESCNIYLRNGSGEIVLKPIIDSDQSYQDGCFRKLTKDEECVLEKNLVFKLAPELIFKVEFKDEEDPEN